MTAVHTQGSGKSEPRGKPVEVVRMMGLDSASKMLGGRKPHADALGISTRALFNKTNGDDGVSKSDLLLTAGALDAEAARLTAHAAKLRAAAGQSLA